jgi:hypothetical protein
MRRASMKRMIVLAALAVLVVGSAFSEGVKEKAAKTMHPGVSGWYWSKEADPMTDEMVYTFLHGSTKEGTDEGNAAPWIGLRYRTDSKLWTWGFMCAFLYGSEEDVTYRIGTGSPITATFRKAEETWCERECPDDLIGAKKVTTQGEFEGSKETYVYIMDGLEKTMKIAGL